MYVRLISQVKRKDSSTKVYDATYEGTAIKFHHLNDLDAGLITISQVRGAEDVGFKKSESELYIMNNEGRTIDHYDWRPDCNLKAVD